MREGYVKSQSQSNLRQRFVCVFPPFYRKLMLLVLFIALLNFHPAALVSLSAPKKRVPLVVFLHDNDSKSIEAIQRWKEAAFQSQNPCVVYDPKFPEGREAFQVYGTDKNRLNQSFNDYANHIGTWRRYKIPIGQSITGKMDRIFVLNQSGGKGKGVVSAFRNVLVYEAGQREKTRPFRFQLKDAVPYAGGGTGYFPTVKDSGLSVHFSDDSRKSFPFNCNVTQKTILEFEFHSDMQGAVHAIGLDTDNELGGSVTTSIAARTVLEKTSAFLKTKQDIDADRIYLVGIGTGVAGVWETLQKRPDLFAGAVVHGGEGIPTAARLIFRVPLWVSENQDGLRAVSSSQNQMVVALTNYGASVQFHPYVVFPDQYHTTIFGDKKWINWLFQQRRSAIVPPAPVGVVAKQTGVGSVQVEWKPVTMPSGEKLKEYRVYRNGGELAITSEPRFVDFEAEDGQLYEYSIRAVSEHWKMSLPSSPVWVQATAPKTLPKVLAVRSIGSAYSLEILFDRPVEKAGATNTANYQLNRGLSVNRAHISQDQRLVRLNCSVLKTDIDYALTISNITDNANGILKMEPVTVSFRHNPYLAACWRMEEGAGNLVTDQSGNGNSLAFNELNWAKGWKGKALLFDGKHEGVAWVRVNSALDLTRALTFVCWVKKGIGNYLPQTIASRSGYTNSDLQFSLQLNETHNVQAVVCNQSGEFTTLTGNRINARDWHHLAITFDGTDLTLYIDGAAQGTKRVGEPLRKLTETIILGGANQGREVFDGLVDEVQIFHRALRPEEIRELINSEW